MPVGIVINPISGRDGRRPGEADHRVALARADGAVQGVVPTVVLTTAHAQATELARQLVADGCDVIVAMGGDGTVNEVAQALVGTSTVLGIVPCGSGDGLARGLGVPRDRAAAMRLAVGSSQAGSDVTDRRIDVGYANGHLFLNVAGVGFDAEVARRFAARATRGLPGYIAEGFRMVMSYAPHEYRVTWPGEDRTERFFLIGFANGPTYGNGAMLAPDADPGDGVLEVLFVRPGSVLTQAWRARRLFLAQSRPAVGLERARTDRATISSVSGAPIVFHVDGEPMETTGPELSITLRPQALTVRAAGLTTSRGSASGSRHLKAIAPTDIS